MTIDFGADLGPDVRLVVAAFLGALIRFEVGLRVIDAGARLTATIADLDGVELPGARALGD